MFTYLAVLDVLGEKSVERHPGTTDNQKYNVGVLAGGIIGGVLLVVTAVLLIVFLKRRKMMEPVPSPMYRTYSAVVTGLLRCLPFDHAV